MPELYVSICIPTNGRINILKKTLDSIFIDCKVPFSEFEVILSDNSTNEDLPELLESYKQYPNIIYKKTDCEGFLNSLYALRLGNAGFLKLHNNYTMFSKDGLYDFVTFIKQQYLKKPLIFFKNSGIESIQKYTTFDEFNFNLSFWNSWSSGFSIWKDDFDKMSSIEVNKMFPHTSLLLLQYHKESFVINDVPYFFNQEVLGKGGYDLFRTFSVDYLKMIEMSLLSGKISKKTFNKIKKNLFYDFLVVWYFNTKIAYNSYTFDLENIQQSLTVYFSKWSYYSLVILAWCLAFKIELKSLVRKCVFWKR